MQAANEICKVYGADAVLVCVSQQWFPRIRSGTFDVEDTPRSCRLIVEKPMKL